MRKESQKLIISENSHRSIMQSTSNTEKDITGTDTQNQTKAKRDPFH